MTTTESAAATLAIGATLMALPSARFTYVTKVHAGGKI